MKKRPSISIILATYNWPAALNLVLQSLAQQTTMDFEVVIADDGSKDDTRTLIQSWQRTHLFPIQHVWHTDEGFQLAKIRNRAIASAKGDYLVFLDGDCLAQPEFVERHQQLAEPGYWVAGSRILLSQSFTEDIFAGKQQPIARSLYYWLQQRFKKNANRWMPLLHLPLGFFRRCAKHNWRAVKGCNFAVWKKDLIAVNGFDESFVGWGHEDSDLIIRLLHNGVYRKSGRYQVPVLHLWHSQAKRDSASVHWQRIEALLKNSRTWAERGLDQYK